jgi:ParB family chromosome partitioning protein
MRLLKLPKEVVALVAEGQLSEGQARPLIGQDTDVIVKLIPRIVAEEWSARKVEQHVVNLKKDKLNELDGAAMAPASIEHAAEIETLRNRFNTKVDIRTNAKGAGKIVIGFKNSDELERIKKLLG